MQIFLLRHGETRWNHEGRCQGSSDIELNETGQRQASEVAAHLSRRHIDAVYSSDLRRARETAEIVGGPHEVAVRVEPDLRELDHGEMEGLTFVEVRERFGGLIEQWRTRPVGVELPGGERLLDVDRRVWSALNRIVEGHDDGDTIVVVSHSFPILSALCRISGTPLDQYRTFHLKPCELSHVSFTRSDGWAIREAVADPVRVCE
ncbi:MAG: histidine phosphatase family protein [Deltaproteobacteria bacterium]|nr:histidine phosphatase family protein [Deltaproteobacteria bacterium]